MAGREARWFGGLAVALLLSLWAAPGSVADGPPDEWAARLGAYVANGTNDITPAINSPARYALIRTWRTAAEKLWLEYQRVEFPQGKPPELEAVERAFTQALADADEHLDAAVFSHLQAAREQIQRIADAFEAEQGWKKDKSQKPKRFADERLDAARRAIDDLAEYLPDHPDVAALRAEYTRLKQENTDRRTASKSLTGLRPDRYKGADAKALREFVEKRVAEEYPGVKVLRITLCTPEWSEATVTEWSDTTHSALRTRTTRELMFCVAFKDKTGVFRDFGYLNQDRTPEGGWGPTYGRLSKSRVPMLTSNIKKDEPDEP